MCYIHVPIVIFLLLIQCSIELFHYACVGLKTEPTLEWYCENCQGNCICKKSIKGGSEMIKCAKINVR